MKKPFILYFLIFISSFILGCQTANSNLVLEYPDFKLSDFEDKTILITPVLTVENNIQRQNQLPALITHDEISNYSELDREVQLLIEERISEELDLFKVNPLSSQISKGNDSLLISIPIYKAGNVYKIKPNGSIHINEELSKEADYFLVPLGVQLESVNNINEQFKSEDLVEPGIKASISYVFIDALMEKVVLSGVVYGTAAKSGMIDRTLGKNEIFSAINNAVTKLIKEFE